MHSHHGNPHSNSVGCPLPKIGCLGREVRNLVPTFVGASTDNVHTEHTRFQPLAEGVQPIRYCILARKSILRVVEWQSDLLNEYSEPLTVISGVQLGR